MFFGPNRPMPPNVSPFQFGGGMSPFQQMQPPNMGNIPNMSNPMMMRNPSSFMSGGRGAFMGGGNFGGANFGGTNGGGGGLLAKLLGRTGARSIGNMGGLGQLANTGGGLGQLASSGALQQLANPSNLTGMLTNVQKALKMAESVMPMVQQYGPLVRNVPAMLKLYSELKNVDTSDDEDEDTSTTNNEEGTDKEKSSNSGSNEAKATAAKPKKQKSKDTTSTSKSNITKTAGESSPKLYV
ncbi:VrrA/YqfQ family protein [Sutcliffiella halmapala]|uniref:VrrA/YqfQ family protein n=1 Tax=Sutcliffiella halmapala TaxID=79882 RepID=UPI0009949CF3|nr:VrrA/YqfQ family protein [Sutcliffiella halmapala]